MLNFFETAYRVQYFRSKLDRKQWQEEIEILTCEIERTFKWFASNCNAWRTLAEQSNEPAFASYCHQAADVQALRAIKCKANLQAADKASADYWEYLGGENSASLVTNYDIQP